MIDGIMSDNQSTNQTIIQSHGGSKTIVQGSMFKVGFETVPNIPIFHYSRELVFTANLPIFLTSILIP